MRADAARNRSAILESARALIAERGADVPIDDIAEAAGLAVGTLYRHFPTKAELVHAIVESSIEQIADAATRAADAADAPTGDPAAELEALLRLMAARSSADRGVKQAAASLGAQLPDVETAVASSDDTATGRAIAAVDRILVAAQVAGTIRDDIMLADLLFVVEALPATDDAAALDRYLDIVVAGLRTSR